jgi:hypothetical protein
MSAVKRNVVQIDHPTIPVLLNRSGVIYRRKAILCPRFLKRPSKKRSRQCGGFERQMVPAVDGHCVRQSPYQIIAPKGLGGGGMKAVKWHIGITHFQPTASGSYSRP